MIFIARLKSNRGIERSTDRRCVVPCKVSKLILKTWSSYITSDRTSTIFRVSDRNFSVSLISHLSSPKRAE